MGLEQISDATVTSNGLIGVPIMIDVQLYGLRQALPICTFESGSYNSNAVKNES